MVVYGLVLLTATLVVMFHFAHRALKDEAISNAEQILESTVQRIDNVLLCVEQTTGNVYFEMINHLDEPERMETYCREVVESNPYVAGCAIVFRPYYYPDRNLFMAYVTRQGRVSDSDSRLVSRDSYAGRPYTLQRWYNEPMEAKVPLWIDPLKNGESEAEPITTFCLPFKDASGEFVGVMAVDLSIELLSRIILDVRSSPNGYAIMLARNGSYIVHPNEKKLTHQTVFEQLYGGADPSVMAVAEAMVAGQTGQKPFVMDGQQWRIFYKPLKRTKISGRAEAKAGWSVGVVGPVDDIYGPYNRLFWYLLSAAILAVLILFVLCWLVIRRQLAPMEILKRSAQRVAEGNYDVRIPDLHRKDEIGRLQRNFMKIQKLHTNFLKKQKKLNIQLKERSKVLGEAYHSAQKANSIKTNFLHYMTNQMVEPAEAIDKSVRTLGNGFYTMTLAETEQEVDVLVKQSETIVGVLDQMLQTAQNEKGKEEAHE